MKNSLVADLLEELAKYTELEDEQPYRARAYRRAALAVDAMSEDIEEYAEAGKLQDIPGVGENIEKKINEILRTGKLLTLEKIKQRIPVDVKQLTKIEGIGPKTVKELYQKLGIRNLDEFENALRSGKLKGVRGLGVKSENQLLAKIESARTLSGRILLIEAEQVARRIETEIKKIPNISRFEITGSFRRRKETVGDLDVLIETDDPSKSIEYFTKGDEVKEVILAGDLKASVRVEKNLQVDVRVVPQKSWGAALLYFTGSKAHNIELRTVAIRKGMRLNEYGLFKMSSDKSENDELVAGSSEEDVYKALDMDYIVPELRENKGEIQAAHYHKLPKLVELKDIKGDLQIHTVWSDGSNELKEMTEASRKLGYQYVAITDHVGTLRVANALNEERVREQAREIGRLNSEYEKSGADFHVLHGCEVNIRSDGKLDMSNSILKEMEIVLASIHSGFNQEPEKINRRMASAMENEYVDMIAHPSGRLILERLPYRFDLKKLVQKALDTETTLEIDGYPNRLDLNDENAFEAMKSGCKLAIDTDAHEVSELEYMRQGVYQARRAWARTENILNTMSYKELVEYLGR